MLDLHMELIGPRKPWEDEEDQHSGDDDEEDVGGGENDGGVGDGDNIWEDQWQYDIDDDGDMTVVTVTWHGEGSKDCILDG